MQNESLKFLFARACTSRFVAFFANSVVLDNIYFLRCLTFHFLLQEMFIL